MTLAEASQETQQKLRGSRMCNAGMRATLYLSISLTHVRPIRWFQQSLCNSLPAWLRTLHEAQRIQSVPAHHWLMSSLPGTYCHSFLLLHAGPTNVLDHRHIVESWCLVDLSCSILDSFRNMLDLNPCQIMVRTQTKSLTTSLHG